MNEKRLMETAVLGAGCFWCIETQLSELEGVDSVESGYCGGHVENPTYKAVCTGETGHAEVAVVNFDPSIISFEDLLEVFWTIHDPTTLNRQGADVGTQYRSAIFYTTEAQRIIAEKSKEDMASQIWDDPIVTEIKPLDKFYPAESYHQNYYKLNPNQGYCQAVISPKLAKSRKRYKDRLKRKSD